MPAKLAASTTRGSPPARDTLDTNEEKDEDMEDEGYHDEERIHIPLDDLVMRNNHKCAEAQTCNHGWTDHSQFFGYGHDSRHKFKCEDGREAPNREKQGCRTVAIQKCGLCRGYGCRSCYEANNPGRDRGWRKNVMRSGRRPPKDERGKKKKYWSGVSKSKRGSHGGCGDHGIRT
ncbi:MAG: Uncharacterized protein AUREO_010770 [Aureobasidium pullulans]|nr:MAG: Uncharacterized protein AUREO_010770 [Aureobasidium pullulans]